MKITKGRTVKCKANDGSYAYGQVVTLGKNGWLTVKFEDYVHPRQVHRSTVTVLY